MNFLSWRTGLAAGLVAAATASLVLGATGFFSRSATPSATPSAGARSGTAGVAPSSNRATPPRLSPPPVFDSALDRDRESQDDGRAHDALEIEVDGSARPPITSDELAGRPAMLQAADRRAWRLTELVDGTYIHANTVIHAITADGRDYILNDHGRNGGDSGDSSDGNDIIVVRRGNGELYVGWLDGGADRPLADAERPAERIERVARIALAQPVREPADARAMLAIVLDGKRVQTMTPHGFTALARLAVRGLRHEPSLAIDVGAAFGGPAKLVSLIAGGRRIAAAPPGPGARPVIYLTRRGRFKLAWVDAAGAPIGSSKLREISELVLARQDHLGHRDHRR